MKQKYMQLNGIKLNVTYILNGLMFNLLFSCDIILYWEKVTSHDKFNHKSKLYGKCQRFNATDGSTDMLKMVEFPKKSIKRKNVKHLKEFKQQVPLKKLFSLSPIPSPNQIKPYYVSGTEMFLWRYTEIYRHMLSYFFKSAVLGRKKRCSANVFSYSKQKYFDWKICKVRKASGCVARAYYFQCRVSWGS